LIGENFSLFQQKYSIGMNANARLENMSVMRIFVFFLDEAGKDNWNALTLRNLREACQVNIGSHY
jgi:hypothetical protein